MATPPPPPLAPPDSTRFELDVPRFARLLDRLAAALAAVDAAGADLAAAVRSGDPAGLAAAEAAYRAATADLRDAAADRAALLRESGAATLRNLAADSRLVHLVSRCGSLAGSLAETRRRSRAVWLAGRRAAAGCAAVREVLGRGPAGAAPAGYAPTGAAAGGGGALFDAAA